MCVCACVCVCVCVCERERERARERERERGHHDPHRQPTATTTGTQNAYVVSLHHIQQLHNVVVARQLAQKHNLAIGALCVCGILERVEYLQPRPISVSANPKRELSTTFSNREREHKLFFCSPPPLPFFSISLSLSHSHSLTLSLSLSLSLSRARARCQCTQIKEPNRQEEQNI